MKLVQKNWLKGFSLFMIAAILNLTVSCNYFRVKSLDNLNAELSREQLQKFQNLNKFFVLHFEGELYMLTLVKVDADKKTMECLIENLPEEHRQFEKGIRNNEKFKYENGGGLLLNEIHIRASELNNLQGNVFSIPLSSISRIDIVEKDSGRTTASYFFITLGSLAGVLAIITIIAILTKSSCPFLYVKDGNSYIFKGEVFGGAIFKPLERDDYLHLKNITLDENELKLKLSNELLERQYTNLLNTILVEHEPGTKAFIDNSGNIHSTGNLQAAQNAVLNNNKNLSKELSAIDSSYCLFDVHSENHNVNELVLKFQKPLNATGSKLILHAKNSLWLDFAFTEFTKLFGSSYNRFIEKQRSANPDSMLNWTYKQHLPLSVYIKENNRWKLVEHIPTVGPLAARDICVPIDLSDIHSSDLEIKLSCGFKFWELDYAAIDFTSDEAVNVSAPMLKSAIDEKGRDVAKYLEKSDSLYLEQPHPGNAVEITFQLPPRKKDKLYDLFVHTRGYYEHVRNYEGMPDKNYLMSFKNEGAFNDFSLMLYDKVIDNSGLSALK